MTGDKNKIPAIELFDKKSPTQWLALGFGSGLAPKAPGTFGTIAALPFFLVTAYFPHWLTAALIFVAFIVGVYLCDKTSEQWGVHDHGAIVWDEFVGMWIALFMLPMQWQWWLAAFLLFRFFDIVKPWPIKWLDKKVEGGFGIMIDDVIAGLFAWCCLWALQVVMIAY